MADTNAPLTTLIALSYSELKNHYETIIFLTIYPEYGLTKYYVQGVKW